MHNPAHLAPGSFECKSEFMRVVQFWVCEDGEKQVGVREDSTYERWRTAAESEASWSWSKALSGCVVSISISALYYLNKF
jgi:hypothetical protein